VRQLREHVTTNVGRSRGFTRELYRHTADVRTALGWFNWLSVETEDPQHRGKVNLKHNGLLPLVDAVRLFALQAGVAETGTLARLEALTGAGVLDRDQQEYLASAFEHLTRLLLSQQIGEFEAERPITTWVHPANLSKRDHESLIDSLHAIEHLRSKLRSEFTADVF
jgi:signal-transduction protein with cAMP-binding, CBS, and nucleotidyltransferase domain